MVIWNTNMHRFRKTRSLYQFKYFCHIFLFTICNRSCGYVFTGVFHSIHGEQTWQGASMVGGHAWLGATYGRGHAWQGACMAGGMCGWGVCVVGACMAGACMTGVCGGMHGWGHTWQGACMAGGHVWQGKCVWQGGMHGRGQERWPLQQTVCILLECILVDINFHSKWILKCLNFILYFKFYFLL